LTTTCLAGLDGTDATDDLPQLCVDAATLEGHGARDKTWFCRFHQQRRNSQHDCVCLHRRVAIIILAVLLAGYGRLCWETLSIEAYPELGDVAAQVTTQIPGLAAEEVEQLITVRWSGRSTVRPGSC